MPLMNRALAEFLGTFLLVFGGCGSAVLAAAFPEVGIPVGKDGDSHASHLPLLSRTIRYRTTDSYEQQQKQ